MAGSPEVLRNPWNGDAIVLDVAVTIQGLLTANGGVSGTIFGSVDAIQYATDPAQPTEACVNAAFTAGAKNVVVSKAITINALITVPPSCTLTFMPGVYAVGDLGQISHGITSSIVGMHGSDLTVFVMTSTRTLDFIFDSGSGAGISSQIKGLQIVYPQPDSTNLATYNQFGGGWAIHVTKARTFIYDVKIVSGWKGIFIDGSNSEGAVLAHLQLGCFNQSLLIDGPVDRTILGDIEIWVYGPPGTIQATNNQTTAFQNIANVGITLGRADTVLVSQLFTFAGLGISFFAGATGVATQVQIAASGFENNGILMNADGATVSVASTYFGLDDQGEFGVAVGAGALQACGSRFYLALPNPGIFVTNPLAYAVKGAGVGRALLSLDNCLFDMADADMQAMFWDQGSEGRVSNTTVNYAANKAYTNPAVNMGLASVDLIGNSFSPLGSGSQVWYKNGNAGTKTIGALNRINGRTDAVLPGSTDVHLLNNF